MKQQKWRTLKGGCIGISIKDAVQYALRSEKGKGFDVKVCIGTDSQVKGSVTEFATVIVFVRKGNGAFMFISKELRTESYCIKQRMMQEVNKSIEVAHHLSDMLRSMNVAMEVHIDINRHKAFKSNEAFNDAVGYITGMGFAYKAKPHAFASSCCANKMVQ